MLESTWKVRGVRVFNLPASPNYYLTRAPLAQALGQVRYPVMAFLESTAGIAPLQERLRDRFPYLEQKQTQEVTLAIGPAGPAAPQTASSLTWELTTDDGFLLVVSSTSATLSVGEDYNGIAEFADLFSEVLSALLDAVGIPRCDRVGVRYLSVAEASPTASGSWMRWFRPEFVSWASRAEEDALHTLITQAQLRRPATEDFSRFPEAIQAIVRHGYAPAGSDVPGIPPLKLAAPSFLLDLDLFSVGKQPFDVSEISEQFLMLHAQIDRFFYWALSDDGKNYFGLELRDGDSSAGNG